MYAKLDSTLITFILEGKACILGTNMYVIYRLIPLRDLPSIQQRCHTNTKGKESQFYFVAEWHLYCSKGTSSPSWKNSAEFSFREITPSIRCFDSFLRRCSTTPMQSFWIICSSDATSILAELDSSWRYFKIMIAKWSTLPLFLDWSLVFRWLRTGWWDCLRPTKISWIRACKFLCSTILTSILILLQRAIAAVPWGSESSCYRKESLQWRCDVQESKSPCLHYCSNHSITLL